MAHLRRYVDHSAAAFTPVSGLEHFANTCLRYKESRAYIERQHLIKMVFRYLDQWFGNVHARIVDEDIKAPKPIDCCPHSGGVGEVADSNLRTAAHGRDTLSDFVQVFARAAQQDNFCSRGGKSNCCLRANAATGPGNESDSAVEPERWRDSCFVAVYDVSPTRARRPTFCPP